MPSADLIKRRKQNCENQKRWRQRQIDELHRITAALDKSQSRVAELEAESEKLRGALRDALSEVSRLQNANRSLERRAQGGLSHVECPSHKTNQLGKACSKFSFMSPEHKRPLIELIEVENMDPCKFGPVAGHKPLSSHTSGSEESDEDWKSIVITDDDDNEHGDCSVSSQSLEACSQDGQPSTHRDKSDSAFQPDSLSLENYECGFPAAFYDETLHNPLVPIVDENESNSGLISDIRMNNSTTSLQGVRGIDCDANAILFNWSTDSVLGGTSDIWQRMMDFPATTRISKHISTVQNVLAGTVPRLIGRSLIDRESIVADAFAWLIRSAWPSCENCFKMMSVYEHIYTFELWRSFPCPATYYRLHPFYRPTALQLTVPHSPVIDWLPWPAMRDRVIHIQKQVDVDQLCLMSLEHTVIEPSLSAGQAMNATFRIWDMYLLEKAEGGLFSSTAMTHDAESPNLQALVKTYNLPIQDITHLRIDLPFYDIFPDMFLPGCTSTCQTAPLNLAYKERLEYPSDLTPASVNRLHERVQEWLAASPGDTLTV